MYRKIKIKSNKIKNKISRKTINIVISLKNVKSYTSYYLNF